MVAGAFGEKRKRTFDTCFRLEILLFSLQSRQNAPFNLISQKILLKRTRQEYTEEKGNTPVS